MVKAVKEIGIIQKYKLKNEGNFETKIFPTESKTNRDKKINTAHVKTPTIEV